MKESTVIDELKDRLTNLEKRLKGTKKPPKDDEEVCPECGGDLLFVEKGIVYCSKCKKYYEEEEE